MNITVFAKKRTSKDGKVFYSFLARLRRKDGTDQPVSVMFADSCAINHEACPMNIIVDKRDANLSSRAYPINEDGESAIAYTLWVKKWTPGEPFVDHSLDDFE